MRQHTTTSSDLIVQMRQEIADLAEQNAALSACLDRRSNDPAWKIANAPAVHDMIAALPASVPVRAMVGDVKDLKVWNTAMGAQVALDAILMRGFASVKLRAGDILGRGDGGDKIFLVCPAAAHAGGRRSGATDVDAVAERINATLKDTALRSEERAAYVRGACAKAWGPSLGRVFEALHYLGIRRIIDYPTIDWVPVADGTASGVLSRMDDADRQLFLTKAANLRGTR